MWKDHFPPLSPEIPALVGIKKEGVYQPPRLFEFRPGGWLGRLAGEVPWLSTAWPLPGSLDNVGKSPGETEKPALRGNQGPRGPLPARSPTEGKRRLSE